MTSDRIFLFIACVAVFLLTPHLCASANDVYAIKIEDFTISPITLDYIKSAIDKAGQDNAECLIIEMDTPGGLLTSTRLIIKAILGSKVPVIVYIYPPGSRAGSAGVFITYASHIAAMAPSTNIGAAHPVEMGGARKSSKKILKKLKDSLSEKDGKEKKEENEKKPDTPRSEEPEETEEVSEQDIMQDKILNDTLAFIKALANLRKRNAEWAVRSVAESASITNEEALKENVIEIIAKDGTELLQKLHGRQVRMMAGELKVLNTKDAKIKYINMDMRQRFLNAIVNPNIAYLLMILGFYGLLYEITHPGIGFPGVAGAICILLAFYSLQTLSANYTGLALIILGILLFVAEIKVPGFGLPTLGGVICMILGPLILFETKEQVMHVSLGLIISFALATAFITSFLVRAVFVSHRRRVASGIEGLAGLRGYAQTDISPEKQGKVFVHGEIWDAISKEEIKKGGNAEVVKVEGMVIEVKKVN